MISLTAEPAAGCVHAALERATDRVKRYSKTAWVYRCSNDVVFRGRARLDEDWLQLSSPLRGQTELVSLTNANRVEELLKLNSGLPGGAKVTLASRWRPCVRVEMPIDEDISVDRIESALEVLKRAAAFSFDLDDAASSGPAGTKISANEDGPVNRLEQLVDEAGWESARRTSQRLAVPLDNADQTHHATLEPNGGSLRAVVRLGSGLAAPQPSREAQALLMLRANGVVRLARAVVANPHHAGDSAIAFEVDLGADATASAVNHALSALSVACRLCARELGALEDEGIARAYLRARGWPQPLPATSNAASGKE